MNCASWLGAAEAQLRAAGVATARLDVLVLLEDAMAVERAQLLAHPDLEIGNDTINVLTEQLARRAQHEPLAYVRGRTEFYGREFIVSPDVLEPRPESETMIELLKKHVPELQRGAAPIIVDVGTGSGALAITAKLELPEASVWGVDIDPKCLAVAKRNAKMHDVKITLAESDLLSGFEPSRGVSTLILLCNLPYVPDGHTINAAALHEPHIAIFGGPDGLDLYRKLFDQANSLPRQPLLILSESLPPQHDALKKLAEDAGFTQVDEDDFIQAFTRA